MDIISVSDLLKEFISAEVDILNKQDIKHPTTIGSMYEGLTETILNKSIFRGLNLKVIKNSFIEGCDLEFDILLIEGEGTKIPFTERYIYKPEQVIAIVQVKKNLYAKDIQEGYDNLKFIINYFEPRDQEEYVGRLLRNSFRDICRKDLTAKKSGELNIYEDFIFSSLRIDATLPIRIIWGYNGFKSELNLRNSFFEYLEANQTLITGDKIKGFGPNNFPSLIICEKYSLLKLNGMPFSCYFEDNENWWPFYGSSSYNPTYFFLEVIWSRLSFKFGLSSEDLFGEDLSIEPLNRYIDCRIMKQGEITGWEYRYYTIKNEHLKENTEVKEWQPVELNDAQYAVISKLCIGEEINLLDNKELEEFVRTEGYTSLNDFIQKLNLTGLVFVENNTLKLLTDECQCAFLPDGRIVSGENKSGRFTNWMTRFLKNNN